MFDQNNSSLVRNWVSELTIRVVFIVAEFFIRAYHIVDVHRRLIIHSETGPITERECAREEKRGKEKDKVRIEREGWQERGHGNCKRMKKCKEYVQHVGIWHDAMFGIVDVIRKSIRRMNWSKWNKKQKNDIKKQNNNHHTPSTSTVDFLSCHNGRIAGYSTITARHKPVASRRRFFSHTTWKETVGPSHY